MLCSDLHWYAAISYLCSIQFFKGELVWIKKDKSWIIYLFIYFYIGSYLFRPMFISIFVYKLLCLEGSVDAVCFHKSSIKQFLVGEKHFMKCLHFFLVVSFQWAKAKWGIIYSISGCCYFLENISLLCFFKVEKVEVKIGLNFPPYQCAQDECWSHFPQWLWCEFLLFPLNQSSL